MSSGLEEGETFHVADRDERSAEMRISEEALATLGHEMRNPLSALFHAIALWPSLQNDGAGMSELRELMDRQVRQLKGLSDDLLDAARTARGTFVLRREPIDLRKTLENACEQVRPYLENRDHSLEVRLGSTQLTVFGDAPRLLQVFANLIQNAAKFMDRGGAIRVTAERCEGSAIVRVRDEGPGIDASRLNSLFDGGSSGALKGMPSDGLGIGLRLVKTIVEMHGGAVEAYSAGLGKGSEFIVRLPTCAEASDRTRLESVSDLATSIGAGSTEAPSRRIVVVDDDRSATLLLTRLLASLGHVVFATNDGSAVLGLVERERPDVVFLDLVMRGVDGCEAARQLRASADTRDSTLIALSGYSDDASKRRALDAGFDAYLAKPASVADLKDALARFPAGWRSRVVRPGDGEA